MADGAPRGARYRRLGAVGALLATVGVAMPASAQFATGAIDLNIFGGTALPLPSLEPFKKWTRLVAPLTNRAEATKPELIPWVRWAAGIQDTPSKERLYAINTRVNQRIRYVTDPANWRLDDFWELPSEARSKNLQADCEGYAIFKYFLAVEAGFELRDLFIMVGTIPSRRETHAVLLIRDAGTIFVLDNRNANVVPIALYRDFRPMYILNENRGWLIRNPR